MTMTSFQREGLHLFGYTKRESEFLFLVATHSGYFTNRQFKRFAQTESGSVSHAFIRKLLDRKHVSYQAYRSGGRVYHLFARKLYQAIEQENLRTRKKHQLDYVKTRLVALDFVLGHSQHHYLETETQKVAFFENEFALSRETLPVKQYRARRSADFSPRYFVDGFPMFVDGRSSPPVVTFTFVEAGAVSLESFATHMRSYLRLFHALPKLELVYLAPTPRLFHRAEAEFYRLLYGASHRTQSANPLNYFRVRKAWEAKERVASADVVLLKEAQVRYAARPFEDLYEKWRKGAIDDTEVTRGLEQCRPSTKTIFRTMICGSSLNVFADPRGKSAESCQENESKDGLPRISGSASIEFSGG